jgi:hypothetical protein
VTIVSEIIGREGIVMASDSRTTFEDGRIRDDTKKVFTVRLADGFGFLLGHAMATDLQTAQPLANTCEADETYVTSTGNDNSLSFGKAIVALIIERDGQSRTRIIPSVTAKNVGEFLNEAVSKTATVNTDEHLAYKQPLKSYNRHDRVNHGRYEYARHNPDGTVSHVNTCESWFSLFKRGLYGSQHIVSREHLQKYASEFEFRWNTRKQTDGERMANFMPRIEGRRLYYRQPAN